MDCEIRLREKFEALLQLSCIELMEFHHVVPSWALIKAFTEAVLQIRNLKDVDIHDRVIDVGRISQYY